MCGIVGAIAERNIVPVLVEGLKRLEFGLRRQIESGDETVVLAGSDDVPDEFRAMVQEYYRSLGKTPR